jgi:hypothetical protein
VNANGKLDLKLNGNEHDKLKLALMPHTLVRLRSVNVRSFVTNVRS